ncbi:energy-coupling factor ABC transporter ATP-binding protein [Brevibacterium linens]|uniref:Energy-coupling factor transport system ATP-binding protein n=2 Tax=Brevibacterium TaxID=1696 RepID=A0A2H1KM70_BRELN|nr:ABC transporter ATP-binding protein [Brevibacterium linens]PCC48817.1 hypothetical protein CIK62_16590 [Brevibacterium aurantiacum]SMY00893.1 energy-coupling factor transport system ATP-binding protein [Brevibacterium linens]
MTIRFENVSYSYRDGTQALEAIDFEITPGARVAIIGQNGAGKTTAAKLMNGLLKPTSGIATVNGTSTTTATTAEAARIVAYVFQNPDDQLFRGRVDDELAYVGKIRGMESDQIETEVARIAELAGIEDYLESNPKDVSLAIRKFVALGALLVGKPAYLIMDEPTAGLDQPGGARLVRIMDELTSSGTGIVTICHDMRFVMENFTSVIAMAQGSVIATGTPEQIFSDDSVLAQCAVQRPEAAQLAHELHIPPHIFTINDVKATLEESVSESRFHLEGPAER